MSLKSQQKSDVRQISRGLFVSVSESMRTISVFVSSSCNLNSQAIVCGRGMQKALGKKQRQGRVDAKDIAGTINLSRGLSSEMRRNPSVQLLWRRFTMDCRPLSISKIHMKWFILKCYIYLYSSCTIQQEEFCGAANDNALRSFSGDAQRFPWRLHSLSGLKVNETSLGKPMYVSLNLTLCIVFWLGWCGHCGIYHHLNWVCTTGVRRLC